MNIKEILNKDWRYSYSRRMTYQKVRIYSYGYWKGFGDVFGFKQRFLIYRFINGDLFGYEVGEEMDGLERWLLKKFSDREFILKRISRLANNIEKDFNNYLIFVKSLPQEKAKDLSNKEIIKLLDKYYKQEQIVSIGFWILFESVEKSLIKSALGLLQKDGLSFNQAEKLLLGLSEPIKIIPLDLERLSLLKAASKNEKALKEHWQKFAYMPMYDINFKPHTLNYFTKRLNSLKKRLNQKQIKEEIDKINKKYQTRHNRYLKTINQYRNKKEIFFLLKFFAAYGYLKDYKPYTRDQGNFWVKPLFEEIAKRLNLTLEQTLFLNEQEIPKLLKKEKSISPKELDKRRDNSVYFCDQDKIYLITNKRQLERIDSVLNKKEKIKELKGLGVSPGSAKGKASIILSSNDFSKFKKDKILVTSATRPEFVPLMRKAKGIITDEGGMLSHAAIVSRELKKPCVVGTSKATRVLKDNDLIELNANKGIVKIIRK